MPRRLPVLLLLPLAAMSVLSLALGMWLEISHLQFLQDHPYVVNLLSSITGFSTSALVVTVGVGSFLAQDRAGRWRGAMRTTLAAVAAQLTEIEEIGEAALGWDVPARGPVPISARSLDARIPWLLAERLRQGPVETYAAPDAHRLGHHVSELLEVALPGMQRAFDMDDPAVHQAAAELRLRMAIYARADHGRTPQQDQLLLGNIQLYLGVLINRITATDEYKRFVAKPK